MVQATITLDLILG